MESEQADDHHSEDDSLTSEPRSEESTPALSDQVTISIEASSPVEDRKRLSFKESRKKVDFFGLSGSKLESPDESPQPVVKFAIPVNKTSNKAMNNSRYHQPRMSLLGKPIDYKPRKWGIRYRKLQAKIYNFLERPKDWIENFYHVATFLLVLICIGLSIFSSIPRYRSTRKPLFFMEIFVVLWLITEYILRMWSSGCRSRYQGISGRLQFAKRPLCIVDMIVIVATAILVVISAAAGNLFLNALQALRFFQILRLVRMDRRGNSWKLLGSVMWAHRKELLTSLYMGLIGLLLSSFLLHLAEKDSNIKFATLADSLWWGVITLCTVGYGDTVPLTWPGKLITGISAICCISFFALPAGILGSGFALKVQQEQRQKHQIRRRVPAAILIQSLWKCYAADENSISQATWKPHMKPCPSPTIESSRLKHQPSFVSRFSSRRGKDKDKNIMCNGHPGPGSPSSGRTRKDGAVAIPMSDSMDLFNKSSHLNLSLDKESLCSRTFGKLNHEEEEEQLNQLTEVHKRAIRAIRKIRYYVARRKFREALRPYDVKDVMEQYSAGHADMLARVKSLQGRLDVILGKSGSKGKDVYESKQSLASRIVGVERKVDDIETKLDTLLDLYVEDRKKQWGLLQEAVQNEDDSPPVETIPKPKIRKYVTYHGPHGRPRHQTFRTLSSPGITLPPNGGQAHLKEEPMNHNGEEKNGSAENKEDIDTSMENEPLLRPEVLKLRKHSKEY